jgi:BirA family biotin operon repressor/biotin-[acetyl-CoA-carboxylase] ligase
MDEKSLQSALTDLPLGGVRYFDSTGSTNDLALAWAAENAPDFSLILADEQTSGRGRSGRTWYTPAGSALALSLILRPAKSEREYPVFFTALGALALTETLSKKFGLQASIKWPNDVLVRDRKIAGILLETVWLGDVVESLVLGLGLNVLAAAVPPAKSLDFPATSLEDETGHPADRPALLRDILSEIIAWRARLARPDFLSAWEERLAYRGQQVQTWDPAGKIPPRNGLLLGLGTDGSLKLRDDHGVIHSVHFGDVRLRPAGL